MAGGPAMVPQRTVDSAVRSVAVLGRATVDLPANSCDDQAALRSAIVMQCVVSVPVHVATTSGGAAPVLGEVASASRCAAMVRRVASAIASSSSEISAGSLPKAAVRAAKDLGTTEIETTKDFVVMVMGSGATATECVALAQVVNDLQCAASGHPATENTRDLIVTKARLATVIVAEQIMMKTVVPAANASAVRVMVLVPKATALGRAGKAKAAAFTGRMGHLLVMVRRKIATIADPAVPKVRRAMVVKVLDPVDSSVVPAPAVRPRAMVPERVATVPVASTGLTGMAAEDPLGIAIMIFADLPSGTRTTTTRATKTKPKRKRLLELSR